MSKVITTPPHSQVEPIAEVMHGVTVIDPYRWLEEHESLRTRDWLHLQQEYARLYLDQLPGRASIRKRIREFLDVETYDSPQKVGNKYFFRKRVPGQEQPGIFCREGLHGEDLLLLDPAQFGSGKYSAVNLVRVSPDGRLVAYELKEGGERSGLFGFIDVQSRNLLPDVLPHGYLRGLAFVPASRGVLYAHESVEPSARNGRSAYLHVFGTSFEEDEPIFLARDGEPSRLVIVPGREQVGFMLFRFRDKAQMDFYLWALDKGALPDRALRDIEYSFSPVLMNDGRILAMTDLEAPNFRIVEVRLRKGQPAQFIDLVPASDAMIQRWTVTEDRILVSYVRDLSTAVDVFDSAGRPLGQLPVESGESIRLVAGSYGADEVFLERESFTSPIQIWRYSPAKSETSRWAERKIPFRSQDFEHTRVWFTAQDGTRIPMFLVGRPDVLEGGLHPAIMTSYGGYGVPMTPQFSVFVAFLMERGCLFALPNIRGGSDLGVQWHNAAKRRARQVAFDDFLSAAEWLIDTGRSEPGRLAIFGGSNSGLLVGAAMTQRPELFRAVICIAPMLDMLRYHLFDTARLWSEEFGTANDPEDFAALASYSPYHNIHDHTAFPATMIVSGDSDQNCNPLHARKMTARLQAANASAHPIFLDYSRHRGHSPVLPLSERIEALTDRMAFLCDQLQLD